MGLVPIWRPSDIWPSIVLTSFLCLLLRPNWIDCLENATFIPVVENQPAIGCCNGTLGYATSDAEVTIVCSQMICCNMSETVAVIPVDVALGFKFQCMAPSEVRPLCYQSGMQVRTSNQDPDHTPRICCEDAKFDILLNQWYAAISVRCVDR